MTVLHITLLIFGLLGIVRGGIEGYSTASRLHESNLSKSWIVLQALVVFFGFGYLAAIYFVASESKEILPSLSMFMFAGVGLFVMLGARFAALTIKSLVDLNLDLESKVRERTRTIEEQQLHLVTSAKMSSLGEMAGGIAHEINNPLAIIQGRAHQLSRIGDAELTPEVVKSYNEKILATCDRISRIVRGLRSFARNSEKDPLAPTPLESILEDTLELCQERFKQSNIELKIAPIPNLSLDCRPAQISQVLLNLLSNAFDAIHGHDNAWVKIDFGAVEGWVRISITDSGKGIPPEIVTKLMQPFFSTKEVGKGTGLGLSISKGIIEDHKGTLKLDTDSPNTRFIIDLPLDHAVNNAA